MHEIAGLPGEAMVRRGLLDLAAGKLSAEALTVSLAPTRLARLGIDLPDNPALPPDRESALYFRLGETIGGDPYYRYNSLRRELDSFLEALEGRRRRNGARSPGMGSGNAKAS